MFVDDENEAQNDEMILTLGIAYEMSLGEESFWFPYFRVLPIVPSLGEKEIEKTQDQSLIEGM